jgi:hypothetical protein
MNENIYAEIILAVIGLVGAGLGYLAQKHAKEANKAVNGNKEPDAIRLYDLVISLDNRMGHFDTWTLEHRAETLTTRQRLDIIEDKIDHLPCTRRVDCKEDI